MRSQTRSANHHMSCRRSRKLLCALENPQNTTGLNLNFTFYFLNDRFVIFQIALTKVPKNVLSLIESRNCALVTRSALGSRSFIRGEN